MKSQAYGVILGVACVLTGCSESQHPADNVSEKSIECLEPEQAKKGLAAMYTTERRFLSHDQDQEALSSDESFPVNLLRNAVFSVHELPMQAVTKVWKREPEERVSHIFAYDDRQYGVIYQTVNADSGLKGQEWSEVQNLLPMDAILAQLTLEQTSELAGCYTLQTYQGQIKGAQVTVSWLAELDLLYYYNESHHASSAHDHHPNEYETTYQLTRLTAESLKPVLNKVLAYQLVDVKEQNAKPSLKQGPTIQNLEIQNPEINNPAIQNIEPWDGASR